MRKKQSLLKLSRLIDNNMVVISKRKNENNILEEKIQVLVPSNYLFKKFNEFGTDWELMTKRSDSCWETNWTISFLKFDYRLLPFLNVKMFCRHGDGTIDAGISQDNILFNTFVGKLKRGYSFIVEDIPNEEYLKIVTLYAHLKIMNNQNINVPNYGKIVVQFINPRTYI